MGVWAFTVIQADAHLLKNGIVGECDCSGLNGPGDEVGCHGAEVVYQLARSCLGGRGWGCGVWGVGVCVGGAVCRICCLLIPPP
jgi:hypothetical protein